MNDRFDRQRVIPGWDQERLGASRVVVCGRGWLGTFAVWGLASLGAGEILWAGTPVPATDPFAHWLLAHPGPFDGCAIYDYPFDIEYGGELDWICAGQAPHAIVVDSGHVAGADTCERFARTNEAAFVSAAAAGAGWIGTSTAAAPVGPATPVAALLAAALSVDAIREHVLPLDGRGTASGPLGVEVPMPDRPRSLLLVGAGGIGAYAAWLAALLGMDLIIVDHDHVEASNLNRQGLFSHEHAVRGADKATATADMLARFFPGVSCRAHVARVDRANAASLVAGTNVVLSAVDNAETRLLLARAARTTGIPLVQAGTDLFAADCFTQVPGGPGIDRQMFGALRAARARERRTRGPGCAASAGYVVPGMVAAALLVQRALQASARDRCAELPPIRWRSGGCPMEDRADAYDADFSTIDL